MENLRISTSTVDDITIVECCGALTKSHEGLLNNIMENSFVLGSKGVLFDFTNVTYFDSMGLECMITLHKRSKKYFSGILGVLITDKILIKIYKTLRFEVLIPLYSSRQKAISAMSQQIAMAKPRKRMTAG